MGAVRAGVSARRMAGGGRSAPLRRTAEPGAGATLLSDRDGRARRARARARRIRGLHDDAVAHARVRAGDDGRRRAGRRGACSGGGRRAEVGRACCCGGRRVGGARSYWSYWGYWSGACAEGGCRSCGNARRGAAGRAGAAGDGGTGRRRIRRRRAGAREGERTRIGFGQRVGRVIECAAGHRVRIRAASGRAVRCDARRRARCARAGRRLGRGCCRGGRARRA
ncbi:Uncharacterised protein [Burkholderia pseudomallei]|nr:Uncharacterised protein [Burkholderia pseudomallei]